MVITAVKSGAPAHASHGAGSDGEARGWGSPLVTRPQLGSEDLARYPFFSTLEVPTMRRWDEGWPTEERFAAARRRGIRFSGRATGAGGRESD